MLKKLSILGMAGAFALPLCSFAQDEESEKRFYFIGGGSYTEGDSERGTDGVSGFNFGLGKRLGKHFSLELKAFERNFDADGSEIRDGEPGNNTPTGRSGDRIDADTKGFALDFFWHLGGYAKWDPYIVVGLGRADEDTTVTTTNPGAGGTTETLRGDIDYLTADIGIGVKNEFTENGTALRIDARWHHSRRASESGDFADDDFSYNDRDKESFDDIVINFDFTMPFGARKADAVGRPQPKDRDGRFYLVPSVQFMRADGDRLGEDDFGYGLAFGKEYQGDAALEFRLSQNKLSPQGHSNGSETDPYDSFKILNAGVDFILFREINNRLRPYILLGVGYQQNEIEDAGGEDLDLDGYTIDYGLGIQSRGDTSPIGWRFDIRGRHVNLSTDGNSDLGSKTSFDDLVANLGAVIPLGRNPYKQAEREAEAKALADAQAQAAAEKARREAEEAAARELERQRALAEAEAAAVAAASQTVDSDGDNVPDTTDKCPNSPAGVSVDANGCELDGDNDGVRDSKDQCPNSPADAEVDVNGCERDNDGDGVPNSKDQCPNSPKELEVDAKGCTKASQVLVLEGVTFETNSADLTPNAKTILNKVAESLKGQPALRVEVGGHTDWVGSGSYNKRLSALRAKSVKSYLGSQGVNTGNMTTKGYGESAPVADNKTAEGRERNRRVELKTLGDNDE